jgi:cytochrome subunit of sulfide dehydrogenase
MRHPSRLVLAALAVAAGLPLTIPWAVPPAAAQGGGPAPLAAQGCLGCHGPNGGGSGATPGIAGRREADLAGTMRAFRANERPGTVMGRIARGYTDAEIDAVAAHFAAIR